MKDKAYVWVMERNCKIYFSRRKPVIGSWETLLYPYVTFIFLLIVRRGKWERVLLLIVRRGKWGRVLSVRRGKWESVLSVRRGKWERVLSVRRGKWERVLSASFIALLTNYMLSTLCMDWVTSVWTEWPLYGLSDIARGKYVLIWNSDNNRICFMISRFFLHFLKCLQMLVRCVIPCIQLVLLARLVNKNIKLLPWPFGGCLRCMISSTVTHWFWCFVYPSIYCLEFSYSAPWHQKFFLTIVQG